MHVQPILYMVAIPTDGHGEEWIHRVLDPAGRQGDLLLIVYGNSTGDCGQKTGNARYPSRGKLFCLHIPSNTFTSGRNIMLREAYRLEKERAADYMYWIMADWDNYLAFNSSTLLGGLDPMDIFESALLTLRSPVIAPWIRLRRPPPRRAATNRTRAGCWQQPWNDTGGGHLAFAAACHPPVEFMRHQAVIYIPIRPLVPSRQGPGRDPPKVRGGFPLRVLLGRMVDTAFIAIHRRAVPVLLPYHDLDNVTWWGSAEVWWAGTSCLGGATTVLRDLIAENTVHSKGHPRGHLPEDVLRKAVTERFGGIIEAGILDVGAMYPPGQVALNYTPVAGVVTALAQDWAQAPTFARCEATLAPFFEAFVRGDDSL
eukprot:jgi/Mesvir1/29311/Mv01569-RA.1